MIQPKWDADELQVTSDSKRMAQYRALQSWYREIELKVPPGLGGPQVNRLVGSMLPEDAVAKAPRLNFLSDEIASYAARRVGEVRQANGTIEQDRLMRNMLSSMPLCFNLFGHLRSVPEAAAEVLRASLKLDIARIDLIEVEWAPNPKEHLGDRTAFDAYIEYRTTTGDRGFLGVETKYTEPFSTEDYDKPRYRELTNDPRSRFKSTAYDVLRGPETNQLWRNALLALSVRETGRFAHGHVLVVACRDDRGVEKAMSGLRAQHDRLEDLVRHVALEDLIASFKARQDTAEWASAFDRRYLNLEPVRER